MGIKENRLNDYAGFVSKFKPKKTTDDCYTPPYIYETVLDWIDRNITPLEGVPVVRPFWPGMDYENFDYPEGCIVIDNPPFSILAKIRRHFHSRGIRYFLFAPTLTMVNSARELDSTYIITGASVIYENGANVNTSFITNLDCGGTEIWLAGNLHKEIESRQAKERALSRVELPKLRYPDTVASPAILHKVSKRGIEMRIDRKDCKRIGGTLDNYKKGLFGGGWLLSERAAAERAAAERAAAERAAAIEISLSERELEIISSLGRTERK